MPPAANLIDFTDLDDFRSSRGLTKPLPGNIGMFIYQASLMVSDYLQWCRYDQDNPTHAQAIKEAVCMQVSTWVEADINPLSEGFTSNVHNVQSASLLGGSFTNSGAGVTGRKRTAASENLLPSPLMILREAGIHPATVRVVG